MSNNMKSNFNHVAISVPDCEAAVKWYIEILGFTQIMPSALVSRKTNPELAIFNLYGPDLNEVRIGFLSMSNDIGFEIFEFIDPKYTGPRTASNETFTKSYIQGGFFHIAITAENPQQLADRVIGAGGRQIGMESVLSNGEKAAYVQDPWGNVVEIASTNFRQLVGA